MKLNTPNLFQSHLNLNLDILNLENNLFKKL